MEAEVKLVKSLYLKGAILHFSVALLMLVTVFDAGIWTFVALGVSGFSFLWVWKHPIYKVSRSQRQSITSKYKLPWYSWFLNFSGGIAGGLYCHFAFGWNWLSSLNMGLIVLILISGIMTLIYASRMQTD
ncbi:MAG: hypothetical protein COA69_14055 [Robiginitomaculum sp.]|nr:MAG: hypothetical protein COA69_14055 [Robiginitomaculum sp.]